MNRLKGLRLPAMTDLQAFGVVILGLVLTTTLSVALHENEQQDGVSWGIGGLPLLLAMLLATRSPRRRRSRK